MTWGSKTEIFNGSVAGTEQYSSAVTLAPGETAAVQINGNPPTTPTDDLLVRVYGTLDESSETWDSNPIALSDGTTEITVDKDLDPNIFTRSISGLRKFRLGFVRSGSTDTWAVTANVRTDGVDLSA